MDDNDWHDMEHERLSAELAAERDRHDQTRKTLGHLIAWLVGPYGLGQHSAEQLLTMLGPWAHEDAEHDGKPVKLGGGDG